MEEYTLDVQGMSSEGCERIFQSELADLSDVGDIEADADADEVRVDSDSATESSAWQAILDAGYDLAE